MMENYHFGSFDYSERGFSSSNHEIKVLVHLNGDSQQSTDIRMRKSTSFKELADDIIKKLKMKDVKQFRLFNSDGIELMEGDQNLIEANSVLYASRGEDFDQSCTFAEYETSHELGRGGYGRVVMGVHKRTKQTVAIKIMNMNRFVSAKDVDMIFHEAETLKSLSHKHIVKIINCYNLSNLDFVFVMEYLGGGELATYVREKGYLSEEEAKDFFKQLLSAIYYCHKEKLIHRDLKLENILFEDNQHKSLKVVDFGIAGLVSNMDIDPTEAGSLRYIAPEVLSGKNRAPSPALDIWAMGCILYGMLHGKPAFVGKTKKEIIDRIKEGTFAIDPEVSERVSPEVIDLIHKILTVDYKKRIALLDIMTHPWLTGEKLPPKVEIPKEETKQEEKEPEPLTVKSTSPTKYRQPARLSVGKASLSAMSKRQSNVRSTSKSHGDSPVSLPPRHRTKTFTPSDFSKYVKKETKEPASKKSAFSYTKP